MASRASRIVWPVYAPSFDGRWYPRYPLGDKPNAGADLDADAISRALATGNISTALRLAGGAQGLAGAAAGVSTAIRLGAGAQGRSNASATLAPTSPNSWSDVTVGFTGMAAQLGGPDGLRVRMDIRGPDWGAVVDDINGASVTRSVGAAYDGTDAIKIVPPSSQLNNGNKTTYACIMRGLDLSNGGAKNTGQVNLGFCYYAGPRYFDLGSTTKLTGIQASLTQGSDPRQEGRVAIFDNVDLNYRLWCITVRTLQSYYTPSSGIFPRSGPDADYLMKGSTTINHANHPPLIGSEWLYFEEQVDYRQNAGNAFGRHRLDVWSRAGYIGFLEIPLNWDVNWDFGYQFARQIEYVGALWNTPATEHPDNFVMISHPIVSLNRAKGDLVGPPKDFLLAA